MPTHPIVVVDDDLNTAQSAPGFVPDAVARVRKILVRHMRSADDVTVFVRIAVVKNEKGTEAQAPESPTPENTPPVIETPAVAPPTDAAAVPASNGTSAD